MSTATGIAFSADGSRMFSVGRDRVINAWTTGKNAYKLIKTMPVYESLEGIIVLPPSAVFPNADVNKRYVVTAGEYGNIVIWEQEKLQKVFTVSLRAGDYDNINEDTKLEKEEINKDSNHVVHIFLAEKLAGGNAILFST